jgi:hypothetical protein
MPIAKPAAMSRLYAASIVALGLVSSGQASIHTIEPTALGPHAMSCESPVRLTRDCSIWQGATRPIALGDYRMSLAADSAGRTLYITQLRPGPSHNGTEFRRDFKRRWPHHSSEDAIRLIGSALEDHGIRLERTQAVRAGRRVQGYFLEFSDDAYEILKRFTVLESEHWLPRQSRVR